MSLTTTLAPSRAISSAISRPMPPPAPVTTTTLPAIVFVSATMCRLLCSCQMTPRCRASVPCVNAQSQSVPYFANTSMEHAACTAGERIACA